MAFETLGMDWLVTMAFLLSSYHRWNSVRASAETLFLSAVPVELSHSHPLHLRHLRRRLARVACWTLVGDLGTGPAIVSVVASDSLELLLLSLRICPTLQRRAGRRVCEPIPPTGSPGARSEGSPWR